MIQKENIVFYSDTFDLDNKLFGVF